MKKRSSGVAVCVGALFAVALILRGAAAWPVVAVSATAVVALGSLVVGRVINGRFHGAQWRGAWNLLGLALVLLIVSTMLDAISGTRGDGGAVLQCLGIVSAGLAGAGVVRLLKSRLAGGAGDVLLEGTIVAAACTYVAWAWAAAQGMDHVATALALVPVFSWVFVVWLIGRLLFLTPEKIVGYRILGAAFVVLLFVDAISVGAKFGGGSVSRGHLIGVALCAYGLWGAAALHPSMRQNFSPAVMPARFGIVKLGANLLVAIVAPVSLLLLPTTRESPGLTALVAASALLPLLLVGYLVRQVRGRARAEHRAQHDELTGLPNRRLFEDRAEIAFGDARRANANVAVLFLDLDRFKAINDSLGHAVGNQLLQGVAKRLNTIVREGDVVARFGGDEFTILVNGVRDNDDVGELARRILDVFARPFRVGGRELHTRTSIGIAMYPNDGGSIDALLKNADIAMYRAKALGRDAFEFYTPGMSVRAQTKLSVESGLRRALDQGTLELHYQPQVDVECGRVFGLEALARWPHPTIGMISPNVFVPIAEESGLVVALGEWALEEACAQTRRWIDGGIMARSIAVNVSARHFSNDGFVETVARALARHRVPPGVLEIEITESIFMRDLDRASVALAKLREMGVRCAIDDFGTGFSGLRYLADMSIDSLKIDQSFVASLRQHDSAPVIDAIIGLGHGLNLDVVAEGVETEEQLRFLVSQGCTKMQGYLFGRPLSASEIEPILRSDDDAAIDGRTEMPQTIDLTLGALADPPPSDDSRLLSAIFASSDDLRDIDTSGLPELLEALAIGEIHVTKRPALVATSLRIAAGTCVGLVPLAGGLAAAHALPNPVQNIVTATAHTVGIDLPSDPAEPTRRVVVASAHAAAPPRAGSGVAAAAKLGPNPSSNPPRHISPAPTSVPTSVPPRNFKAVNNGNRTGRGRWGRGQGQGPVNSGNRTLPGRWGRGQSPVNNGNKTAHGRSGQSQGNNDRRTGHIRRRQSR